MSVLDEAIRAAYDASPEYDCGEVLDGFQVTPGGRLSYAQWCESDPDLAADFDRRIEAAARVLIPHNPTPATVEALAAGHWEHGHTIAWQELGPAIRADLMEYALAAYRAQPIWQELWGAK